MLELKRGASRSCDTHVRLTVTRLRGLPFGQLIACSAVTVLPSRCDFVPWVAVSLERHQRHAFLSVTSVSGLPDESREALSTENIVV